MLFGSAKGRQTDTKTAARKAPPDTECPFPRVKVKMNWSSYEVAALSISGLESEWECGAIAAATRWKGTSEL